MVIAADVTCKSGPCTQKRPRTATATLARAGYPLLCLLLASSCRQSESREPPLPAKLAAQTTPTSAEPCRPFGPQQFTRTAGMPNEYDATFSLQSSMGSPVTLRITNGDPATAGNRVSSATISLNGQVVVAPSAFGQQVDLLERTLTLPTANALHVRLASEPGAYITIEARYPDRASCDDGNACTSNDICTTGVCAGTAYDCDDGLGCTTDSCKGDGGCNHIIGAGSCVIDGACYANGAGNPANLCQMCDPATALAWSNRVDGATCANQVCIAGVCQGVCAPGSHGCNGQIAQTCDETGNWQPLMTCTNQACVAGVCQGVCAPGSRGCNGQVTQTCSAEGAWQDSGTCTNLACVAGVCQRLSEPCPPITPVWNAAMGQCDACDPSTPVWNALAQQCEAQAVMPVQWSVAMGGNAHWYSVIQGQFTWQQAVDSAGGLIWNGLHGHLATITSASEQTFILSRLSLPGWGYWIGGFQDTAALDYSEPAGGWRWITGEVWSYTNWSPGEPSNSYGAPPYGAESYLEIVGSGFGNEGWWNDFPNDCSSTWNQPGGYVLEYEP